MKRILLTSVILVALLLGACGAPAPTPTPTKEEAAAAWGFIDFRHAQQLVVTYMLILDAGTGGSALYSGCGLPITPGANEYTAYVSSQYDYALTHSVYSIETEHGCLFYVSAYSGEIVAPINYQSRPIE